MIKSLIPLALLIPLLSGCISSSVKGFTDPDHVNFKPKKILMLMSDRLGEAYKRNVMQLTNAEAISRNDLFLPTRTYSEEKKAEIIVENNIDAILSLDMTGDRASNNVTSYQTYSNTTGTSTTVPVTTARRNSSAKVKLYKAGRGVAWVGTISTTARGSLYTNSDSIMDSMAENTIKELIRVGHLDLKKTSN